MHELGQEWIVHTTPFRLKETTIPTGGEIVSNVAQIYAKDKAGVSTLYWMSDAGTEYDCSSIGAAATLTVGTTTATSGTVGSILFVGTGPILQQDNANLFWDDTNNDLLIGATTHPVAAVVGRGLAVVKDTAAEIGAYAFATGGTLLGGFRAGAMAGTKASPSGTTSGQGGFYAMSARDSSGNLYSPALIGMFASEAQTSSARGAHMTFETTAIGATTRTERLRITGIGNVTIGTAAVATTATDGFLYVTACAGVPTGVPTAITGRVPIVADSTNNKLYIYSGGAWVALN